MNKVKKSKYVLHEGSYEDEYEETWLVKDTKEYVVVTEYPPLKTSIHNALDYVKRGTKAEFLTFDNSLPDYFWKYSHSIAVDWLITYLETEEND